MLLGEHPKGWLKRQEGCALQLASTATLLQSDPSTAGCVG